MRGSVCGRLAFMEKLVCGRLIVRFRSTEESLISGDVPHYNGDRNAPDFSGNAEASSGFRVRRGGRFCGRFLRRACWSVIFELILNDQRDSAIRRIFGMRRIAKAVRGEAPNLN